MLKNEKNIRTIFLFFQITDKIILLIVILKCNLKFNGTCESLGNATPMCVYCTCKIFWFRLISSEVFPRFQSHFKSWIILDRIMTRDSTCPPPPHFFKIFSLCNFLHYCNFFSRGRGWRPPPLSSLIFASQWFLFYYFGCIRRL